MSAGGTSRDGSKYHELPDPALGSDEGETTSNSENPQEGRLPRDMQRQTTFYDYATEKQISFADAKLFYQKSQKGAQRGGEGQDSQQSMAGSPPTSDKTYQDLGATIDNADLQRSTSLRSAQSGYTANQR